MININVTRSEDILHDIYTLNVSGHSGYAEKGSDIVCSATSILFMAAGQQLWDYWNGREHPEEDQEHFECVLSDGEGYITATVSKGSLDDIRTAVVFDMLVTGFEMLKDMYPKNVDFTLIKNI